MGLTSLTYICMLTHSCGVLTGIVWLPCSALMAAWASAWDEYFTKAQPKEREREGRKWLRRKRDGENNRGKFAEVYITQHHRKTLTGTRKHSHCQFFSPRGKCPTALLQQTFSKQSPLCWRGLHHCWLMLNKRAKHATLTPLTTLGILWRGLKCHSVLVSLTIDKPRWWIWMIRFPVIIELKPT